MSDIRNIKYWGILLGNIADGVKSQGPSVKIGDLMVTLWDGDSPVLRCDLCTVLDYIANDTYWNENDDWSEAERATVAVTWGHHENHPHQDRSGLAHGAGRHPTGRQHANRAPDGATR